MKRGQDNHTVFHQNQDIIVTTTVVSVAVGQFHKVLLLQYLKCGAAVLRA
jgi:hypothetical protein